MKVVINRCFGGFGLSNIATELYLKKIGKGCFFYKQTRYEHEGGAQYSRTTVDDSTCLIHVQTTNIGDIVNTLLNESYWYDRFDDDRGNKHLIDTIEELGCKASSGDHAELEIVDIPDGVEYTIDDYDGVESIHEVHRSW